MKHRFATLLATGLVLCFPVAAQTADEIIAKNIAARGGLTSIKAVHSITITGRLTGTDVNFPIVVRLKRPNSFRMDMTVQGKVLSRGYDGRSGWLVDGGSPSGADNEPQPVTGSELKIVQDQADFDGPLVDYKTKGHKVEFVGKETVNQTPCFKLKIALVTGTLMYQYLDAGSYLAIREELIRMVDGTEETIEESIGDYRKVDGVLFPHLYDSNAKGSPEHHRLIVEKMELNSNIDDAVFKAPQAKPGEKKQ